MIPKLKNKRLLCVIYQNNFNYVIFFFFTLNISKSELKKVNINYIIFFDPLLFIYRKSIFLCNMTLFLSSYKFFYGKS